MCENVGIIVCMYTVIQLNSGKPLFYKVAEEKATSYSV